MLARSLRICMLPRATLKRLSRLFRVSLQATADARQFLYDQQAQAAFNATMQAAQTQSAAEAEIALIEARATAQQGDQNMIATGTASAIQAVATQQAYDLQVDCSERRSSGDPSGFRRRPRQPGAKSSDQRADRPIVGRDPVGVG